jgi:hypothetical protein
LQYLLNVQCISRSFIPFFPVRSLNRNFFIVHLWTVYTLAGKHTSLTAIFDGTDERMGRFGAATISVCAIVQLEFLDEPLPAADSVGHRSSSWPQTTEGESAKATFFLRESLSLRMMDSCKQLVVAINFLGDLIVGSGRRSGRLKTATVAVAGVSLPFFHTLK